MKARLLMIILVVISMQAFAQVQRSELGKLKAFLGHWKTEGEFKDTPYSKAHPSKSEMSCDWTPNHAFLLCDQTIHTPTGDKNDLSLYTYNEQSHVFRFFGVSQNDAEARTTKLTIEDNRWTYLDEGHDKGKHVRFRTTNKFTSPTTMSWRSEYSEDGVHWTLMGEGTDTRVR
jgi:hypothetical protein